MEHGIVENIAEPLGLAVHPADGDARIGQLQRESPQCDDHAGLDEGNLLIQKPATGLDLIRLRVTVVRWPALDNIGDEHLSTGHVDLVEQRLQQVPCCPHKGQALLVFVKAGGFPNKHEPGGGRATPGDGMSTVARQAAPSAVANLFG